MYVSMREMLQKANRENYAVMAINCFNMETAKAVIDAAAESHAPIIVDLLQDHLKTHLDHRYLTQPIIRMAENVNVEVAINLDHGQDIAFVKQCLHEGFSSVMMDASMHPLEKNIAITKEIVQFAQAYNASVEAEVGDMGAVAGDQYTSDAMYTDPEEAIHFIRATGVDCLALSYGSSHGDYPAGYRPAFRFDIVQTIKEATDLPLVLHGGSGAGRENILRSVALEINKINVGADFMKAQRNALHQQLDACPESDYPTLIHQTIEAGKAVVKEYIELSGSKNKSL